MSTQSFEAGRAALVRELRSITGGSAVVDVARRAANALEADAEVRAEALRGAMWGGAEDAEAIYSPDVFEGMNVYLARAEGNPMRALRLAVSAAQTTVHTDGSGNE